MSCILLTRNVSDSPVCTEPDGSVMVHTHTLSTQLASVPGSRKVKNANDPRLSKVQLNVCRYNVRTLKDSEKEEEFKQQLTAFKWGIIGLSETGKKGEQLKKLRNGHVL